MLTNFEKFLYNEHLLLSRKLKGKPYRLREDFEQLENQKVEDLKRLSSFFEQFENISVKDFFTAPYIIYPQENHFPLSFYLTRRAINAYNLYLKKILNSDPDSDAMLEKAEESFEFIKKFISEKGIDIDEYPRHCEGLSNSMLLHLKDGKIPIYFIFSLNDAESVIKSIDEDLIMLWFDSNFFDILSKAKFKFHKSVKLKQLINNKIKTIKQ